MVERIKLAIIDDERLIREGLEIILSDYDDIQVVAQGENGLDALEICKNHDLDLVLMDIRMPLCDGVEGTLLIKQQFPQVKVLILTTFTDTEYIRGALRNGASGYLLKDSSHQLIHEGIKASLSGTVVIHPEVAHQMLDSPPENAAAVDVCAEYGLTQKECELVKRIAAGLSNKEVGEEMYLSEGTVKNYVSAILTKLDLRDRTQIVAFAYKNKMVR